MIWNLDLAKWILGTQFGRAEAKWSIRFGKRGKQTVAFAGELMGRVLRERASKVQVWWKHHLPHSTGCDRFFLGIFPPWIWL